ncbi:MAG: hypothetical protein GX488_06160 [Clostridiales bacterium]|nr:hypothetical protein [Clostridiales bacterium]
MGKKSRILSMILTLLMLVTIVLPHNALAANVYNQDGFGYSGQIAENAINTPTMIGYDNWPSDFTKDNFAFSGGVFDGTNIWMIPYNADRVIKIDTSTGLMTGYNSWPAGFTKVNLAF